MIKMKYCISYDVCYRMQNETNQLKTETPKKSQNFPEVEESAYL